jgi:UDP-N-acetylmuramyl pentapeptide phosphotransferase/UDP-N-acetylglucosamine-1-phosphate transferase
MTLFEIASAALLVLLCAGLAAAAILIIRPFLIRHIMAVPNARSSHVVATPQGAGLAVLLAVVLGYAGSAAAGMAPGDSAVWIVLGTASVLAMLGLVDDARALPVGLRLGAQAAAAFILVLSLPDDLRIVPALPVWLEKGLLLVIVVGFVNAVNFLDGLDLMTVAQVLPIAAGIAILYGLGTLPDVAGVVALALLGAILGFGLFNRHPASVFLGDAGSLPIGFLLAWLLIQVASVSIAAAVLFPLYTLADAAVTLCRRALAGEPLHQAHRSHFYQRAAGAGFDVPAVSLRVFVLGLLLASLAICAVLLQSMAADIVLVTLGLGATLYLLMAFAKGR